MIKAEKITTNCPQCGSVMLPDDDHTFEVRVFVCSKPTCLHRIYPDYPKRNGNQEICYLCDRMFTVQPDELGVLCPACKNRVNQYKQRGAAKRSNGKGKSQRSRNVLRI